MDSLLKTLDGLFLIEPSKNAQLHKPHLIADGLVMAEAGDGVLFFDPDGTGEITEKRQYVFTEWDRAATNDMEALASVFDINGQNRLTAEFIGTRIQFASAT